MRKPDLFEKAAIVAAVLIVAAIAYVAGSAVTWVTP